MNDPEYTRTWQHFRSGPPAIDPRQRHHHALSPDAEFGLLCAEAENRSLDVELTVGRTRYGSDGGFWRTLDSLIVRFPDSVPLVRVEIRSTLRAAATEARRLLEAL